MEDQQTLQLELEQQKQYPGLKITRDNGSVVVDIPIRFYRRNGRFMILRNGQTHCDPQPDGTLDEGVLRVINALGQGFYWQELIESGQYASIDDLARSLNMDRTTVGRTVRLTGLAPTYVQSILDTGRMPEGMSLESLRRDLPVLWKEQDKKWGKVDYS